MKISTQFFSKLASQPLALIGLGCGACAVGMGIFGAVLAQPATAQQSGNNPQEIFTNQNDRDPLTDVNGLDFNDLIHRAQVGIPDIELFNSQQQENYNSAIEEFRRQRSERLGNPEQLSPSVSPAQPEPQN